MKRDTETILKCNCATFKDAYVEFEVLQDNLFVSCSNRTGNSYNKIMLNHKDIEKIKKFLDQWDEQEWDFFSYLVQYLGCTYATGQNNLKSYLKKNLSEN